MAKNKIPLSKPSGSDGSGNIQVPGGPRVLDLGDFDDIFGPLDADSPKQGPLGEFYEGLKQGFSDRFKTKDVVRNFLRAAAPDGINNVVGIANEAASASRDIMDSLERTNPGDLQYIAKRAQGLMPKLQDYLPDDTYNKINQGLENKIDEYDYTIQSKRDQTAIRRAAKEEGDDNVIKEALDNIALTERLNHNRSEGGAQARHQQNRAEQSIRDVLQTKRFDFMARAMGQATEGVNRLVGYTEQVNYGFQRKGLELQFRTYLGIKELVKLGEANIELNARAYNAIVRNTALSDHDKKGQQGLMNIGRETNNNSFVSRAAKAVGGKTLSNFLGGYGQDMQGRIGGSLSRGLGMGVMAAKMGAGSAGNLWDNKWSMAGNMAGEFGADVLLKDIIPMLGREAKPHLTKLSDRMGGRHNQAGYFAENMPAFLQEFVNNGQNQHGLKGKFRDLIAPFVPQYGKQDRLTSGTFQTIDQPAEFNQATQRSIVDAIPGYLSRILQELRKVSTGDNSVAREVFDWTTGKFTVESAASDNLLNKIIPKSAIRGASTTINDTLNTMDEDGSLSPEARKVLSERLLRDASTNKRFDPEAYLKSREYASGTSPEIAKELETFFRSKFDYDEKGSMVDSSKNHKIRQDFSQAFLDIRSVSRDPINEINRLINTGHTEPLRAMGIITTEEGQDKINYPRIWEILRSGVTDGNPWANGGDGDWDGKEDKSGDKNHKSFVGPAFPGHEKAWAKNKMSAFREKYAPEEQAARDKMAKHLKTMRGRFGSAAEMVQGYGDDLQSKAMGGYSKLQGALANGKSGYDNFVGGDYNDVISQAMSKAQEAKGYAVQGMEQLTDLYSKFDPKQPLIKGIDFSKSDLIDVNTRKIITKPSEITGKVINLLGQTVVTEAEAVDGLVNPKGEMVVKVAEQATDTIGKALGLNSHGGSESGGTGSESKSPNDPEVLNGQDWSLQPGAEPVITSRGMKSGEYIDKAGKVLNSIADITGDVFDKAGNLIMTGRDFANGLFSTRKGTRYRPSKGFAKLLKAAKWAGKFSGSTATSMTLGALKFGAKAALGIGSKAFNFFVDNQNAYLPGDDNPIFTRKGVNAGEYFDEKGKSVSDFLDVYGPLYSAQGEPLLPTEQYKDLKNWDGSKHVLAKNRGIVARILKRPMRFMKDKYIAGTKKYYGWLGKTSAKAGAWLGRKTLGGFAKAGSKLFNSMFDKVEDPNAKAQIDATLMASQQQQEGLAAIVEAVNGLKPKEKRKGSWQDQADRKVTDTKGKEDDDEESDGKGGFFKRGLAGIASLFGMGKKKGGDDGEEDEEGDGFGLSDAADLADIKDSMDRRGRDGGRAKPKGRGKVGRLGKMFNKLKSSRMGQWGTKTMSRLGGTKVGKWAARAAQSPLGRQAVRQIAKIAARPNPYIIGAAVAAAAGAYLWSNISASSGQFRKLRLAQYGIRGMRREIKVLEMEALLEKFTDKSSDNPSFSLQGAGAKDLLDTMGIDPENMEEVNNFAKWLEVRFKPIYLAWIGGLNKVGQSTVKINDIDDKLPKELKADLLDAVKFPYDGETPYANLINPFDPDDQPENNTKQISEMFDELKAEYDPERKAAEAKVDEKGKSKEAAKVAAGVAGTAAATGTLTNQAKAIVEKQNTEKGKDNPALKAPGPVTLSSMTMSGEMAVIVARVSNTITGLQAIRMRAYGVQTLHMSDVRSLLSLEAAFVKDLTVADGVVDYNGDEGKLLITAGQLLGKDTSVGSADRPKLYNWLTQRFGPSFRAYYGTAKVLNPSADLKTLENKLSGADKVSVGQAVLGAVFQHDRPVWDCDTIFDVKGPLGELKKLADMDIEALQKESEKEVVNSPTQKGSDQMAGKNAADSGGSFTDKVMGTIKDTWNETKSTISSAWNTATEAVGNAVAGAKIAIGGGAEYGEGGASGGTLQSSGTGGEMLSGTGGKFEELPYPNANASIKAAYPTLLAAAKMTGVPVDWLTVIAGIESNFNYEIKSKTSSATGWFQFIDATWDGMVKSHGGKYGIPGRAADPGRRARKDPRANALMGAEYIKTNYNYLSKKLNRKDLTDTDVYMAHFLGAGGATKFFKADPNAMAYKVFSKEYSANMPLFFVNSKPSQPRTIAGIYKLFQEKMDKFWNGPGKGYRQGKPGEQPGEGDLNATAQTPGGVQTEQVASEAETKDKLQADAANKDGVHAGGEGEAPAAGPDGAIEQGSQSVQQIARETPPMPGTPATSGGGSTSSVQATGTDSGAGVADSQQQSQIDAAQVQNSRRREELKRDAQKASDVNDIWQQQLSTLFEIRDLIKVQNENASTLLQTFAKQSGPQGGQGSGNNMNPSGIQGRPAADRQSALTLR